MPALWGATTDPAFWNAWLRSVTSSRFSALSTACLQLAAHRPEERSAAGCLLPGERPLAGTPDRRSRILSPFATPASRRADKRQSRFEPLAEQPLTGSSVSGLHPSHAGPSGIKA